MKCFVPALSCIVAAMVFGAQVHAQNDHTGNSMTSSEKLVPAAKKSPSSEFSQLLPGWTAGSFKGGISVFRDEKNRNIDEKKDTYWSSMFLSSTAINNMDDWNRACRSLPPHLTNPETKVPLNHGYWRGPTLLELNKALKNNAPRSLAGEMGPYLESQWASFAQQKGQAEAVTKQGQPLSVKTQSGVYGPDGRPYNRSDTAIPGNPFELLKKNETNPYGLTVMTPFLCVFDTTLL